MENYQNLSILIQNIDKDVGYEKIRKYGRMYGFHNIYFRQIIWQKLLGIDENIPYQEKPKCQQYDQLVKDVNRSLNTIQQIKNFKEMEQLRKCLMDVLDTIFSEHPNYSYYQGYHDIVSIFILVLGVEQGFVAGTFAAQNFFKDYLDQELATTVQPQCQFIRSLLLRHSRETSDHQLHLLMENIEHPTCTIPWILTWFSHSLENINDICRIWDFLLCSHQNTILYVCAAFIAIHSRNLDMSFPDDLLGEFQEFFQNLNNKERMADIKLEQVLKLAELLEKQYKFLNICEQANIQFSQNSIVYDRNFSAQLPYYKQLEQHQNSIQNKLFSFLNKNQDTFISLSGVVLSFFIQQYIIKH